MILYIVKLSSSRRLFSWSCMDFLMYLQSAVPEQDTSASGVCLAVIWNDQGGGAICLSSISRLAWLTHSATLGSKRARTKHARLEAQSQTHMRSLPLRSIGQSHSHPRFRDEEIEHGLYLLAGGAAEYGGHFFQSTTQAFWVSWECRSWKKRLIIKVRTIKGGQ